MCTDFRRECSPATTVTAALRTPSHVARRRTNSMFALPSTAGAAMRTRNPRSSAPTISERRAFGTTCNET